MTTQTNSKTLLFIVVILSIIMDVFIIVYMMKNADNSKTQQENIYKDIDLKIGEIDSAINSIQPSIKSSTTIINNNNNEFNNKISTIGTYGFDSTLFYWENNTSVPDPSIFY